MSASIISDDASEEVWTRFWPCEGKRVREDICNFCDLDGGRYDTFDDDRAVEETEMRCRVVDAEIKRRKAGEAVQ